MASDGLWDLMPFSKAAKTVRHKLPHQAVSTLMQTVARDRRMADDVSIIIADLLPPPAPGVTPQQFPASALQVSNVSRSIETCISLQLTGDERAGLDCVGRMCVSSSSSSDKAAVFFYLLVPSIKTDQSVYSHADQQLAIASVAQCSPTTFIYLLFVLLFACRQQLARTAAAAAASPYAAAAVAACLAVSEGQQ